ncbi:MAG TPA: dihydrofolate reductase, partial [Eubacteriaceae bacterium]|nr:dihydrofolate reductase [Eubacteriaceae bacterium]
IMGRKTFESLPRILDGREHIVLTRNKDYTYDHPQVTVVYSVDELLELTRDDREYPVIGGSEIFRILLPYTDRIYLTRIDRNFEADVYFDMIDEETWEVVEEREGILDEKNTLPHVFYTLERK